MSNKESTEIIQKLKKENDYLIGRETAFKEQIYTLKDQRNLLNEKIDQFKKQIYSLKSQQDKLNEEITFYKNENKLLSDKLESTKEQLIKIEKDKDNSIKSQEKFIEIMKNDLKDKICQINKQNIIPKFKSDVPLISIIINNYSNKNQLIKLIKSFNDNISYLNYEIIIIDKINKDNLEILKNYTKMHLKIIKDKENNFYSFMDNQVAKIVNGEYLLFLNSNIIPLSGWLNYLMDTILSKEDVGAVGGRFFYSSFINENNKTKCYALKNTRILFKEENGCIVPYCENDGEYNYISEEDNEIKKVGAVKSLLLVKRSTFEEVNGFDITYANGYEYIDLCLKLIRKGYTNYYNPKSMIYSVESEIMNLTSNNFEIQKIFTKKWNTFLKYKLLLDKYKNNQIFTDKPLTLVFVIPNTNLQNQNEDYSFVLSLIDKLKIHNWNIKTIEYESNDNYYDIEDTVDILISLVNEYNINKIKTDNGLLIKIAWILSSVDKWVDQKYIDKFDIILTNNNRYSEFINNNIRKNVTLCSDYINDNSSISKTFDKIILDFINKPKIAIKMPVRSWDEKQQWGDYFFAEGLEEEFIKRNFIVRIYAHPEWEDNSDSLMDIILVLRGLHKYDPKPQHYNMMWNISHPDEITFDEYDSYDKVFIASEKWTKYINNNTNVDVECMLQCTNPNRFYPDYNEEYKHELLFVGNSRGVNRKILKDLLPTKHELAVYGADWENKIDSEYILGKNIPNKYLRYAYSSCNVLLNDHWEDMKEKGFISNRIFDGVACGALIISDNVVGLEEIFSDNVKTYETPEELKKLIDEILKKPFKVDKSIIKEHTFFNRVDQMIKVLNNNIIDL